MMKPIFFSLCRRMERQISIGRTTLDSSRVHDRGDHHRTVDQNLHQEASQGSPADAWTEMERSIIIKRAISIGRAISSRWPRFSPIFISPWQCVECPRAPNIHQTGATSEAITIKQIEIGRQQSKVNHDHDS